jgi:dTDP-D-glucose 4,6-dehydratase
LCPCARTLHGTGRNTRNFLYVEDVARAFDTVLHKGLIGNIYNIGGTNEFSNLEVAKKLLALMGKVRRGCRAPCRGNGWMDRGTQSCRCPWGTHTA